MPSYILRPNKNIVIQQWGHMIDRGAGYPHYILETVEQLLTEADMPGLRYRQMEVSQGGRFGRKRDLLIVAHNNLRKYHIFIGARDVGIHLEVSWFMTISPGLLSGAISKRLMGSPQALSMRIPIFDQQDLNAWITVVEQCVGAAVTSLMNELKQETTGLNTKSKGFLQLW